mmetsp:Transcript_98008/g.238471  ORF Transcript_98008/g.238471 Transcript_98008/m.238471 type:complete len:215 (+) Transcript_98008:112-756(+)
MTGQPLLADGDSCPQTLYNLLGVSEDVSSEDLTRAYRAKALSEHPDKGGEAARFDEITKAFRTLEGTSGREAYDEQLAKEREREKLVERPGGAARPTAVSEKQAQAPMRVKTEPLAGSKRQGKLRNHQPGQGLGPKEWRDLGSGAGYLKMLMDGVTDEQKTERLLDKYATLPNNKEQRRKWVSGINGHEKRDLKAAAKKREQEEMAKWQKWLAR